MRLGQAAIEALRAEITGCLKPGDELVVACPVALKGTSVIAKNKKDKLAESFSAGFIQNCVSLWDAYGAGSIVWKIFSRMLSQFTRDWAVFTWKKAMVMFLIQECEDMRSCWNFWRICRRFPWIR